MTRFSILHFAAAASVVAAGIAAPSISAFASGETQVERPDRAARSAERATRALDRRRLDDAVRFAEEAVSWAPNDPAHRATLGQAYLAAGRFMSAEESFAAARTLGATDARTIIGQSLALIALGRGTQAAELLDANMGTLPASDYGLALALAGQNERGAMILMDVARATDATARDRQNLALTLAMNNRWLEAQLIAAQDVGPQVANQRIEQWGAMLRSPDPRMRVAGLIGATPADDQGMPIRLALNAAAGPRLAAGNDPAPLALYAPAPPADAPVAAELPAAAEAEPVRMAMAEAAPDPAPEPAPEPVSPVTAAPVAALASADVGLTFVSNPVIQPLRSVAALIAPLQRAEAATPAPVAAERPMRVAAAAPRAEVPAPAPAAAPRGPVATRGWAVQLGAYESIGVARAGWARLSQRHAALGNRDAISTSATVGGRTFYRLTATGFASRGEAAAACAGVTRAGGACFVRQLDGRDTVRWASRQTSTRVASR